MKNFRAFVDKYMPGIDIADNNYLFGYTQGMLLEQLIKQCGDDLSRENIIKQARNFQERRAADGAARHQDQHVGQDQHELHPDAAAALDRHALGPVRRGAGRGVRVIERRTSASNGKEDAVKGLMQNQPLLLSSLLRHADRFHADTEIVSRTVEGPVHRYDYRDAARRTRKLADALRRHGIFGGDRVATLAWNNYRHFELEHGVTGLGAGLARDQSAARPGADLLHRQSCRR